MRIFGEKTARLSMHVCGYVVVEHADVTNLEAFGLVAAELAAEALMQSTARRERQRRVVFAIVLRAEGLEGNLENLMGCESEDILVYL